MPTAQSRTAAARMGLMYFANAQASRCYFRPNFGRFESRYPGLPHLLYNLVICPEITGP